MLCGVIWAEAFKYKRTLIPWLAAVGGFFPVFVALLFLLTSGGDVTWALLCTTALNYMNMLALLFFAVFAGHVFVSEYRDSRTNMTFTYPIPRLLLYTVKLFMVLLPVIGMYVVFLMCIAVSGNIFAGGLPEGNFAPEFLAVVGLSAAANFILVPVTAAVSIALKNAGAYILAGIGYFAADVSFAGSDAGRYMPPSVPDMLLKNYMTGGALLQADAGGTLLVCAAVFICAFCAGAACYARWEI